MAIRNFDGRLARAEATLEVSFLKTLRPIETPRASATPRGYLPCYPAVHNPAVHKENVT